MAERSGVHRFASNSWMTVMAAPCAMQRGQSTRETSHITGVQAGCKKTEMICMHSIDGWQFLHPVPPQWGGGIPDVQSDGCWILLLILCPGPHLWNVDLASLVLVVRLTKMIC